MNENHSRTVSNHFLACFLDDCASLDVRAEVMHEEPHPPYAWAPWCACAAACACGGQNGSGSQLKVKAFGWWKTFGTLRQESACSSAQVGNRKRRLFEVLVSHTPPVGTIAVFAGSHWSISLSVLYHCFLWNRFWNRSSSRHITQREKQLGLKCRSQTPTIYQCYETVWLSTDPSALQLTFRNPGNLFSATMRTLVQCLVFSLAALGAAYGVDSGTSSSSCLPGRSSQPRPWMSEEEASNYARCHVACVEKVRTWTSAIASYHSSWVLFKCARRKLCVCVSVCYVNYS